MNWFAALSAFARIDLAILEIAQERQAKGTGRGEVCLTSQERDLPAASRQNFMLLGETVRPAFATMCMI